MAKYLIILFFSFSAYANSCFIEFYSQNFYNTDLKPTAEAFIKNSNCSSRVITKLSSLLSTRNSRIYSNHLAQLLRELTQTTVTITPRVFTIQPLSHLIKDNLPTNIKLESFKLNFGKYLHLTAKQRVTVGSINFHKFSKQTVKINISQNGNTKTEWATIKALHKVKTIIATKQLTAYSPLFATITRECWVSNPTEYFSDFSNVHFYQTIRPILPNTPIKLRDISARTLVKAGIPTKVILINKAIKLSTTALPYQNGKLGDSITLRNIKSGKKIQATVSNLNEVTIKL